MLNTSWELTLSLVGNAGKSSSSKSAGLNRGYMGVSKKSGTPKSSILIGFSIINHPFLGTPILGNTHMICFLFRVFVRSSILKGTSKTPRKPFLRLCNCLYYTILKPHQRMSSLPNVSNNLKAGYTRKLTRNPKNGGLEDYLQFSIG